MPKKQLFINGADAYIKWGMSMESSALSAIMTPAGMKENIVSNSRLEDGARVCKSNPRVAPRTLNLIAHLSARSQEEFFKRYESFCEELEKGFLNIETIFQPDKTYKLEYNSCTQFAQYMRGLCKFTLKLTENNPKDRTRVKTQFAFGDFEFPQFDFASGSQMEQFDETQVSQVINDGLEVVINISALYDGDYVNADLINMNVESSIGSFTIIPNVYTEGKAYFNVPPEMIAISRNPMTLTVNVARGLDTQSKTISIVG